MSTEVIETIISNKSDSSKFDALDSRYSRGVKPGAAIGDKVLVAALVHSQTNWMWKIYPVKLQEAKNFRGRVKTWFGTTKYVVYPK